MSAQWSLNIIETRTNLRQDPSHWCIYLFPIVGHLSPANGVVLKGQYNIIRQIQTTKPRDKTERKM